jgi:hypothetical protein
MKTLVQKITLIFTVAFFTISLNAQNTKSIHGHLLANKLTNHVSGKFSHIGHELAYQMEKMIGYIKYSPSNLENEALEFNESVADFSSVACELESTVKFQPVNLENESIVTTELEEDYLAASLELGNIVKYRPSKIITVQNTTETELNTLTSEIASTVKYQPNLNL